MTVTRRTILTAVSAAAAVQAQRNSPPNWKPRLGVLMQYSDSNLDFIKAEGFTSAQLRLNPDQLDDAAIAAIKDKIAKSGIYISSLAVDGNHIDPDPAKRDARTRTPSSVSSSAASSASPTSADRAEPFPWRR